MLRRTLATAAIAAIALAGCSSDTGSSADAADAGSDRDFLVQAEEIQAQLDPIFEGCEWEVRADDGNSAQTACSEHEIGVIVSSGPSAVGGILDAVGESLPTGGFVAEDDWAVWSTVDGNVNMAWDVLGASGERGWF